MAYKKFSSFTKQTKFASFLSLNDNKKSKELRLYLSVNLSLERHFISSFLINKLFLKSELNDVLYVKIEQGIRDEFWYISKSQQGDGFRLFEHKNSDGDKSSFRIWDFQRTAERIMDDYGVLDVKHKFAIDDSTALYKNSDVYRIKF